MQCGEAIGAWAARYGEAAQASVAAVTCAELTPAIVNQDATEIDPCADAWEASGGAAAISGGARCHDPPAAEADNMTAAISIHPGMSCFLILEHDSLMTTTVLAAATVVISMPIVAAGKSSLSCGSRLSSSSRICKSRAEVWSSERLELQ